MFRADWLKPGAIVLDVGINVINVTVASGPGQPTDGSHTAAPPADTVSTNAASDVPLQQRSMGIPGVDEGVTVLDSALEQHARIVGDVATQEVREVASAVTPVPGGIGPMTIAALVHNVVLAARYSAGLPWAPGMVASAQHSRASR
jgi:5,10-methylene-tetrahydrofolate dehydrogenase/methenyl tetrahydrofolate cyclohydrolase